MVEKPVEKPVEKKVEKKRAPRKKIKKNVATGIMHVKASFNNTVISITDHQGNTLAWASCGLKGFKGARKGTPYAAGIAASDVLRRAQDMGLRTVTVKIKGPGAGRESALRAIQSSGVKVTTIEDITPIPHNGCRPPKRRRV